MANINMELNSAIDNKQWTVACDILNRHKELLKQHLTENCDILHHAINHDAPADIITMLISPSTINKKDAYDGDTALIKAIVRQRWELVPVLIQHGADNNLCDYWDRTPLYEAVCSDVYASADIIIQLISPHNINMQSHRSSTALNEAVRRERWELVPVLLQHGADISLYDRHHRIPLHLAAYRGAPADIITHLISPSNINMPEEDGSTALHGAVRGKRWELVPILLQNGADINLWDRGNRTSLHWALLYGAPEDIVTQLISPQIINIQDIQGYAPLHMAVSWKRWKIVEVLLKRSTDINLDIMIFNQKTPLHLAAYQGAPADLIPQLISRHNINMRDGDGFTALHQAVKKERWDLVPILLQHGTDVNLTDDRQNQTPLHCAVHHHASASIITQLISPHNINMQDGYNFTVLHVAVRKKRWELVPVLLQHGADPSRLNSPQPVQPLVHSLKALCIVSIRTNMPVKSDAAYEGLGLPGKLAAEAKLRPQAEDIVKRESCE